MKMKSHNITTGIKPTTFWPLAQCLNHAAVYSIGIDMRMMEEQGVNM
jgi:hypothetical protein